jgi:tetratricopeptide (TPR) repeat protein
MIDRAAHDGVDFGALPREVDDLLQRGVVAYRRDRAGAEALFRQAMDRAPDQLAVYFCLYKIHTYQGRLDEALRVAEAGLREAARQAGWAEDPAHWSRAPLAADGPTRFALFTLKALAFIHLKRGETPQAERVLERLADLDPEGRVGWRVIADLARGL